MTHNEIYLSLVERILDEHQLARVYSSVPMDDTIADLLVSTGEALVGYLIVSHATQFDGIGKKAEAVQKRCTANYLAVPVNLSEQAFCVLPDTWGLLTFAPDLSIANAWCAVRHAAVPRAQLDLLWESELHDLLRMYDVPLLRGRSEQFLREHIVKRINPLDINTGAAHELLYRDYNKAGQPDMTFWSPELEVDEAWTELYENEKDRPHATPMSAMASSGRRPHPSDSIIQPMSVLSFGSSSDGAKASDSSSAPESDDDMDDGIIEDEALAKMLAAVYGAPEDDLDFGPFLWQDEDPFETPPPNRGPSSSWYLPEKEIRAGDLETGGAQGSNKTKKKKRKKKRLQIPEELRKLPETVAEAKHVSWNEIEAWPGVPWISRQIIEDFVSWLRYGNKRQSKSYFWYHGGNDVSYDENTGAWHINNKSAFISSAAYRRLESKYGIDGYNALRIFEAMLNLRQIRLESEERTAAALERQDLILEAFQKWLFADKNRRQEVEDSYNEYFSSYLKRSYDGSVLGFPALNPEVQLYSYQKNAVAQILCERNTLLAFDVGAGKTFIMAAAAMKLRQMDPGTKNLFVVPNNIVGQWESIFHQMYKDARLLVIDPKVFKPSERRKILKDIRDNDYDGIIMAYSCFEMIELSHEEIKRQEQQEIKRVRESSDKHFSYALNSTVERSLEAVRKRCKRVNDSIGTDDPDAITLDRLGVTMLYVDEAHNFKNVPIRSSLKTVAGLNLTGSVKCLSMYYKVRAIQDAPEGRGVVFATGTPLSNSLVDCYTMQMYLQRQEMEAKHFDVFDNWIKSFARPEAICEIDVDTARFRYVNRLAFFHNLPELSRMFAMNATFYAMDETDDIPELFGYTNVLLDRNQALDSYMKDIVRRTELIRAKKVPKSFDNMLKISTDGRKAALDLRLVDREQPKKTSKIAACAGKVLDIYNQDPDFTQIVFCDYSTPKREGFTVYAELKNQLIAAGVPESEIEFVHTATTTAKKKNLFDKVNNGEIRVLVGSTFKLGIGANVQTHLKAVHHLDIPWRPADMVQREGRILRKGNTNDRVKIFRYISEGSFDSYCWQLLETKQKFISQFLAGAAYDRTIQDLEDNVLTYAQVKALAISEPLMKDLAEKQNALRRLRLVSNNFEQDRRERDQGLDQFLGQRKSLEDYARKTEANAEFLRKNYDEPFYKNLYKEIADKYTEEYILGPHEGAEELCGFEIRFPGEGAQNPKNPYTLMARDGEEYRLKLSLSTKGNARRFVNFFKNFDDLAKDARDAVKKMDDRIEGRKSAAAQDNPYVEQIAALEQEISALRKQIMERADVAAAR